MKKSFALLVVAALVLGLASPVAADAVVVLTGGSLNHSEQLIDFGTHPLTGADQTFDGTTTEWLSADPTGTGAGWHMTIAATDFVNADHLDKPILVSGFKMTVPDTSIVAKDASSNAEPTVTGGFDTLTALGAEQTYLTAAIDEGMGSYGYTPEFSLNVKADAYAGTYNSTVTVAIVAAP